MSMREKLKRKFKKETRKEVDYHRSPHTFETVYTRQREHEKGKEKEGI